MKSTIIQDYYRQTQQYQRRHDPKGLMLFLEEQKSALGLIPKYQKLLEGEVYYHKEKYSKALQQYLQCAEVDDMQFFCYRATAFLCYHEKKFSQAFSYAKKTLRIEAKDYDTLKLLYKLLDVIATENTESKTEHENEKEEKFTYFSVAEKELQELTEIF